jgi:hypothetical protein
MRKHRTLRATLFVALTTALIAGCGTIEDIRQVTDTVDDAVELLDAIEQNGAWDSITDGLENLDAQDTGYMATVHTETGPVGADGAFTGALAEDVTIELRVDAQGASFADVTRGDVRRTFYTTPADGGTTVYEIIDDQFVCANNSDALLRDGLSSVFEDYASAATGAQLLAVIDEVDEDAAIAGRDATRYALESRVPDAIAILKEFDNPELQARLDEVGSFTLAGDLYLDEETGALLSLTSDYAHPVNGERAVFRFTITQWGNVPDIPPPPADSIAQPCPD